MPRNISELTKLVPSEHLEQEAFKDYVFLTYPKLFFYSVPNGGLRKKIHGKLLKAEGLTPGVPDLCFPALNLYIEMKRKIKLLSRLTPTQKYVMRLLTEAGCTCFVAYGAGEAIAFLDKMMKGRQRNGLPLQ